MTQDDTIKTETDKALGALKRLPVIEVCQDLANQILGRVRNPGNYLFFPFGDAQREEHPELESTLIPLRGRLDPEIAYCNTAKRLHKFFILPREEPLEIASNVDVRELVEQKHVKAKTTVIPPGFLVKKDRLLTSGYWDQSDIDLRTIEGDQYSLPLGCPASPAPAHHVEQVTQDDTGLVSSPSDARAVVTDQTPPVMAAGRQ